MKNKSYTELRGLIATFTNTDSADTVKMAFIDQLLNQSILSTLTVKGGAWGWLETLQTQLTVASQQAYEIPNNIRKINDVYVLVGNTTYRPRPIFDSNQWKIIIASNLGTSDVPLFYYKQGSQILFEPTPASSGNTISVRGRLTQRDLSIADYTTGTVDAIANGATTLTGDSTVWTAPMAGRFIKINESDTANKGDGEWYEIASITNTTTLELTAPYQGTTITSAGAAVYTIGQTSIIPSPYDMAPVYRATAIFFSIEDPLNPQVAERWWRQYDGGVEAGLRDDYGGVIGTMLDDLGQEIESPWIDRTDIGIVDINDFPENLTGFS